MCCCYQPKLKPACYRHRGHGKVHTPFIYFLIARLSAQAHTRPRMHQTISAPPSGLDILFSRATATLCLARSVGLIATHDVLVLTHVWLLTCVQIHAPDWTSAASTFIPARRGGYQPRSHRRGCLPGFPHLLPSKRRGFEAAIDHSFLILAQGAFNAAHELRRCAFLLVENYFHPPRNDLHGSVRNFCGPALLSQALALLMTSFSIFLTRSLLDLL